MYCLRGASSGLVLLHLEIFGRPGRVALVLKLAFQKFHQFLADEGHSSTFQHLSLALNPNFWGFAEHLKEKLRFPAMLLW